MNTSRKFIACSVVAVIAGAHALCFAVRKDYWPFSHYEMYAGVRGDSWSTVDIVGIADNPSSDEVKLPTEGVRPPRNVRVSYGINRLVRQTDDDSTFRPQLESALRTAVKLYNRELPSVQPSFIPLKGLRLYREQWTRETTPDGRFEWKRLSREKIAEIFTEV